MSQSKVNIACNEKRKNVFGSKKIINGKLVVFNYLQLIR